VQQLGINHFQDPIVWKSHLHNLKVEPINSQIQAILLATIVTTLFQFHLLHLWLFNHQQLCTLNEPIIIDDLEEHPARVVESCVVNPAILEATVDSMELVDYKDDDSIERDAEIDEDITQENIANFEAEFAFSEESDDMLDDRQRYEKEKQEYIDRRHHIVKIRRDKGYTKTYHWKPVPNKAVTGLVEYPHITLQGFPFKRFDDMHFPYGELFLQLYPATDWETNLQKLNRAIERMHSGNDFKLKHVTAKEWWTFHALMLSPQQVSSSGMAIFKKDTDGGLFPAPDFERFMQKNRFKRIKQHFAYAFSEEFESKEQYEIDTGSKLDDWYPVNGLVWEFNKNRRVKVAASCKKTVDEIMSPWHPTTTETGGLPHLSFIAR
jgi:hypothetical protein